MLDSKIPQEDIRKKDELLNLIDERKNQYTKVLISFALSQENNEWKNNLLTIMFLHKGQDISQTTILNYGDFIIGKILFEVEEIKNFITNFVEKGTFVIPSLGPIRIEGTFEGGSNLEERYFPSNQKLLNLSWPSDRYLFRGATGFVGRHHKPLISSVHPLYPDSKAAIKDIIGIDLSKYDYYPGKIIILLPNYKAKITQITIERKNLLLKIKPFFLEKGKIIGKLYIEYEYKNDTKDIVFENDEVSVSLKSIPTFLYLCLLSRENDEVLDYIKIHLKHFPEDVILKISPEEYLEIIKLGENETTEFKEVVVDQNKEDFLETVDSFSNTNGGIIFVGVDNNGKVLGIREDESTVKDRIEKIVREKIEPTPKFEIETEKIDEKSFIVVKVLEGSDKPYILRDKGIFIRYGSTDRIATRHDLDELYKKSK